MSKNTAIMEDRSGSAATMTVDKEILHVTIDTHVRMRLMVASAATLVLGLALLYASYSYGLNGIRSLILTIAGISIVLLAIMFFYLSPARFLRSDVADAMCMTTTQFMHRAIVPLSAGGKYIYVPRCLSGDRNTLLLVSEGGSREAALIKAGIHVPGKGFGDQDVFVVPPGYGLMEHAERLGATFTEEGLEDEIRDVLVSGFELAGKVNVEKSHDRVYVEIRNVSGAVLCATLRAKEPDICTGTGCPLCSFVGCMVAEGTGRKAVLNTANARRNTIRLSFRLV